MAEGLRLELLYGEPAGWQMGFGERAALEGLLAHLEPSVAVEIGTFRGGSLRRIAAHSGEVHTFDVAPIVEDPPANVTFHVGDSAELLPRLLAELEAAGRNVDFALVDGDHSTEAVRTDLEHLLASPAVGRTFILLHDARNEGVREAIDSIDYSGYGKVRCVDPDWVPARSHQERSLLGELFGGLALVVVDATLGDPPADPVRRRRRSRFWTASPWHAARPLRTAKRRAKAGLKRWFPALRRPQRRD